MRLPWFSQRHSQRSATRRKRAAPLKVRRLERRRVLDAAVTNLVFAPADLDPSTAAHDTSEGTPITVSANATGTGTLVYELLGSDNGVAAFQTPLATGHIFNGFADVFLVIPPTGLQDFYGELKYKVPANAGGPFSTFGGLLLIAQYHEFRSAVQDLDYGSEFDFYAYMPLKSGFYAEATLHFVQGRFVAWPYTYPDYAGDDALDFFTMVRERWRTERELKGRNWDGTPRWRRGP